MIMSDIYSHMLTGMDGIDASCDAHVQLLSKLVVQVMA